MAISSTKQTEILKIVAGLFNAAPGGSNLSELAKQVEGGMTTSQLADALASIPLFTNGILAGKVTVDDQVNVLMNNFGVTADSDATSAGSQAKAYFAQQITNGVGFGKIVFDAVTFLSATTDTKFAVAQTLLNNKALVAAAYSKTNSSSDLSILQKILSGVAGDKPYTETDVANVLAGTGLAEGGTFLLGKGVDDFNVGNGKATAGNDTYIAAIDSSNVESNTLNTGDVINGDAGVDTLKLTRATIDAPAVSLKNIEKIQIRDNNGAGFDLANADSAVNSVINENSTASTGFFNAANNVALTVKDITATGLATTVNFKAGVLTGDADTASIVLNNVAAGLNQSHTLSLTGQTTTTNGYETVAIKTEGAASSILALNVAGTGTSTLNKLVLTGDKNLTLGTQNAGSAVDFVAAGGVVDASAFAGDLSINLDNGDKVAVTGGSGNDAFLFGGSLTSTDKIDGGAGVDTLGANNFSDIKAAFAAGAVSNIEAIRVQNDITTAGTLDVSKAGNVNAATFGAVNAAVILDKLADASTVTLLGGNGTGNLTANILNASLAGTANTLNVNLGKQSDAAVVTAGTITAPGVETINVSTAGTVTSGSGVNALTISANSDLTKLNVTGNEDVTLTFSGNSLNTFNASTATGIQNTAGLTFSTSGAAITGGNKADILTGGNGNDVIVGGDGNDVITGGAGSDALTGGNGSDTFVMSSNGNAVNLTNPIVDTVKDFQLGSGGDTLNVAALSNLPVIDGAVSLVKVSALNGALPAASTVNDGRAELIVLDSSIPEMQAANASALDAKLFNLASAGYGNVLVAYSDSAAGNVRIATANINNGDITNITDFAALEGVTTSALASGFHINNLGFSAVGGGTGGGGTGGGGTGGGGTGGGGTGGGGTGGANVNVPVNAAGTSDASTGNFTYQIGAGTYTYTINKFDAGDKFAPFTNAAVTVLPDTDQTDGIQNINFADAATGSVTTVSLIGLTAAEDSGLFNLNSINTVFGAGTI